MKTLIWTFVLTLFSLSSAYAADLKLGVVSVDALLQHAPQVKIINQKMQERFSGPKNEMEKLEKTIQGLQEKLKKDELVMTQAQKDEAKQKIIDGIREYREKELKLKNEVDSVRNQALAEFRFTVQNVLNKLAEEQNYDMIFSEGVAYTKKSYDLTQEILLRLEKQIEADKK